MLICFFSLSPALTARSFAYWSFRVTLMFLLLRCQTITALWTSLRISIRTFVSDCPLSSFAFSIFSCIVIICPVIVFRGVGSLCYRSAATAAQERFACGGGFVYFRFCLAVGGFDRGFARGALGVRWTCEAILLAILVCYS